jgi:hypothetical protein
MCIRMEMVKVKWRDAVSDEGSYTMEEIDDIKPLEITSIGFLWFEDNEKLVIARDTFPNDHYRGLLVIPRQNIAKVEPIGELEDK